MKYTPKQYVNSGFWSDQDSDVQNHTAKVVRCRRPRLCCCGCGTEIKKGEHALLERGRLDGEWVSCHTALTCIDKWLDELGLKCGDA